MSSRMHSKPARTWEKGSPGRRRPQRISPSKEHFHRRNVSSPDRSKRGKWESPAQNRIMLPDQLPRKGFESRSRTVRKDVDFPKPRRNFGDEHYLGHNDYRSDMKWHKGHNEGPGPAGLVFLCDSSTIRDCFRFRVLGLPGAQRNIVEQVIPGTKLFLFNIETKELYGVFEAATRGGLNLVPEAFQDSRGAYTAQVRFTVIRDYLPLADEETRDVLRDNFSQKGKFDCELSGSQVVEIIQLFSQREIRHQHADGPAWDIFHKDNRNDGLGASALGFDAVHMPVAPYLHESNLVSDSELIIDQALADAVRADPASVLAQGVIEEVDQLAFKYLRNYPGSSGIHLDPVNTSLLSTSLRNQPLNFGQLNLLSGANLPEHGLHSGPRVSAILESRLLAQAGFPFSDSAKRKNVEHPINDGGLPGDSLSGSFPSERGLLPVPGMHHQMPQGMPRGLALPPQLGVMFPGNGGFPGIHPEMGPSFLPGIGMHPPFHPLQGNPHMIRSQMFNQPSPVKTQQLGKRSSNKFNPKDLGSSHHHGNKSFKKVKKYKQKKKFPAEKRIGGIEGSQEGEPHRKERESAAPEPAS